jgi:hypothetical protein
MAQATRKKRAAAGTAGEEKIKLQLLQLLLSLDALGRLNQQPLPGFVAFKVNKIVTAVDQELAQYEQARLGVCKRYGPWDDGAQRYLISEEKRPDFNAEIQKLQQVEVTIPFPPLLVSEVLAGQGPATPPEQIVTLRSQDFRTLSWLILE